MMVLRLMQVFYFSKYGNSAFKRLLPALNIKTATYLHLSGSILESNKFSTRPEIASKKRPFQDFYDKIKTGYKNNGVVNFEIFTLAVQNISEDEEPTEEQSLFMLESLGFYLPTKTQKDRVILFKKIWKYLKDHNLLTKNH